MKRLTLFLLLALSCTVLPAQDMTSQLRSMGEKLIEAIQKGRQQEAEGLADKYLALCTKESYRYIGHYYAEARHIKAHSAAERSDFYTALQIMDDVIETRLDKRSPRDDDRLGDSYFDRSTYQESNELAIADLRAASDAYLKAKEGSKYAKTLCILADLYGEAGDAASEAECYEKAYNYADKGTKEYLLAANHMMKVYNEQKKFSKVNALAKALQKTAKKVTEKEPIIYADFLLSASVAEANTGNYAQALEYANEASGLYENEHLFTDHNYAVLLKNTADIHFHLQHYQDAIAYYERAKPLLMQAEGRGPSLLELYRQLVATYEKLNRPDMVVKITDEMNQLFSTSDTSSDSGSNFGTDANSLAKQAQTLAKYGNYSEAVEIGNKALHLYESRGESRELAIMYNSQSKYYAALRKYQTADSLNTLSLNLSHKKDYTEEEALAYHQKAKLVDRLGKFAQANEACTYATSLLRESGRSSSTTYASILCDQGYYQYKLDSLQNAISLTREALDLKQSILGPDHGENVLLHFHLAEYYRRQGQMDSVAYFYHNAIKLQTELVRNYFSFQNTNERELFWQRQNYPYQAAPSFSIYPDKAPAELLTDLYNAQLFTKGILLNSEIDFRQLLQNSGDQEILAKYEDLQRKREDLQKYYEAESANSDSENRIKQLKQDIEKLERAVVYKCKEYGDFTQNLKLTADSVRRAMHPQEAAVEFLEANINHNGHPDRLYLALILRPEWDAPHACRLFWRSDMEELGYPAGTSVTELLNDTSYLYQDKIYNDCRLGQLVWKNLLQELNGATHIFFAPTGVFYQWGIEYMPINDSGTRISDTLSVSRLSSTKLLAQRSKKTDTFKDGDAVVYGGMDYTGMRIDDMRKYKLGVDEEEEDDDYDAEIEEALQKEAALSDLAANDTEEQSSNTRGAGKVRTFQNLPHAGKEAREIARILKENTDMDVKRYGAFGTEGSFKALSGHDISLLHIATHGFSCTPGKEDAKWLEEINPQTILTSSASDKLLNYSGLVFSGCNNIITYKDKKKFPKDIDDGILTAQEIAQLNLQDLQLTVLSACQTGTGMLQEDGVFGVQRGFKKAGAHTLVMSLWSVSDPVTMLMMTTFYEALRDEPSLSKAFLKAQKAVREQYPRPQDWAPFIMLDDI